MVSLSMRRNISSSQRILCDSRWEFRLILTKSGDAEYAACVLAYLPKLQALEEGVWFLSVVAGRPGGPVLGCLEANRAFSLELCFQTLSARFKTLPKDVVEPRERSEEIHDDGSIA